MNFKRRIGDVERYVRATRERGFPPLIIDAHPDPEELEQIRRDSIQRSGMLPLVICRRDEEEDG
jgi:hypothetical protein